MAHIYLLVLYTAIAFVVNIFDILMNRVVMKDMQDNLFFYIAMVEDILIIIYLFIGLIFAVWAFWGMPTEDKENFIFAFYILVVVFAIASATVIIGIEGIIWRNPGEFIDLTWLFELVMLGYHLLKWVIVLSYTIYLAIIGRTVPSAPARPQYQLVPQMKYFEMQPAVEAPKMQFYPAFYPQ